MKKSKPIIGIYGYGRFGRFWANQLKKDFDVHAYNSSDRAREAKKDGVRWVSRRDILKVPTLFLCVPISSFGTVVKDIASKLKAGTLVFDTCSVKEIPVHVMKKFLPTNVEIIATHPMFGPDSGKDGIRGLPFVYYPVRASKKSVDTWTNYFKKRGLKLIRMTPHEHDLKAAYTQGVAHYLARVMDDMSLKRTQIDVTAFSRLMDVKDMLTNDTWQLFCDLQQKNIHTKQMRIDLMKSMKKMYYALFPKRVNAHTTIIGVQGDRGSFSEIACKKYCTDHKITTYKIKYLVSAGPVLRALYRGEIDYGVVAIQNAQGGVVLETIEALSKYNAKIHDIFPVLIEHCLLVLPETKEIANIISHSQALKQCHETTRTLYPKAHITPFKDTALAAKWLSKHLFPKGTAVIAPENAAHLYKLHILKKGVQDLGGKNLTDFMFISNKL